MSRSASTGVSAGHLDAYRTTGSSPTNAPPLPTLHLLGPGAVGREVLRALDPTRVRLVAVSDRSGTLYHPDGLQPTAVADLKERHSLGAVAGASHTEAHRLLPRIGADVVIDATATDPDRPRWHAALALGVVARRRGLLLAAKDALAARAPQWLAPRLADRLGINAALGGTGRLYQEELPRLRARTRRVALAGNASTTVVLEAMEAGATLEEGITRARGLGLLEEDPTADLKGRDAAVKLAVVIGGLTGRAVDPAAIPAQDLRDLDPDEVRHNARLGRTTRLVARRTEGGVLGVAYESLPRTSPLAVPRDRVAYVYESDDGRRRLHLGHGLGAAGTARALLADLARILATRAAGRWT